MRQRVALVNTVFSVRTHNKQSLNIKLPQLCGTKRSNMKKKKTKWDKLPIMCWSLTLYKEDDKGNQKFYEYTGDHSFVAEGMENEYLSEIDGEDA